MKSLASRRKMMKTVPPDPTCSSTLESIRQNPKFARLLGFSVNNLSELLRTINPKHRVNAYFIMEEKGHNNLIQALKDHKKNESLVYSVIQCLARIISSSKQFQEEYCFKIVQVGAPQAIHELINAINKNSEAMRLTMPLIGYLAASRSNVQHLIEAGLMDDCVNIIKDPTVDEDISREAMETLIKFTNHPKAKQELIKPGFVKSIIDLIEQRIKDKNTVIAGLKIISSILSTNEGYDLLKTESFGLKIIVKVLENYPEDKAVNSVAAYALEKLATIEDIENALNAVKAGNTSQVPLLSSLLLVEDLLRYVVNKGGILDLISVMEKQLAQGQPESVSLVRSCVTALGRIAASDTKYLGEIFQHNGIDSIRKACETENPDIVQACCDTLQKFAVDERTAEEIVSKGTVRTLIGRFETLGKNEIVGNSMIEALGALGRFSSARKEITEQKGAQKILDTLKEFKTKKDIQENGIKALSKLVVDAHTAVDLIEDGVIDHLSQVNKNNPQWRRINLHTVKVFESICQLGNSSSKLDKSKIFEVLVDVVTTGVSEAEAAQSADTPKKDEDQSPEKVVKDEKNKQLQEKLTEKQEIELRNAAVNALEEITNVEDVHEMKISLEDASQTFAKGPNPNAVKALQKQLKIFSTIALLPKVAELLIQGGIPEKIARNAKIAASHPAFPGKSEIIKACTMFFEHLAHHGPREDLRSLLSKPNVKQASIEDMMVGLGKDTDEKIALQTMKAGSALLNAKIIEAKDKFTLDQSQAKAGPAGKGDKEASAEKFIGGVISTIKKFEEEGIQVAGLKLLISAINSDKGFIQHILTQGGTRLAVSNLESMNTTLEVGKLNLELLSILMKDTEAVKLLVNQNAAPAILSFLSANHNPEDLAKLAAPILETLAADYAEQEIEELMEALSGEPDEQDRLLFAEALEHVANLALVDKNIEVLLKKNALKVLLVQLKREIGSNIEILSAQGALEIHQRTLNAILSSVLRIRSFANQNQESTFDKDLVNDGILDSLSVLLQTRSDFVQPVSHSLNLLSSLLKNTNTQSTVLQKCAKPELVSVLTSFLELYKSEESIINATTELLLAISNKFPELVSKMGQKSFVRALIKETKNALKLGEDDASALVQANQNLRCLVTMSDNSATLGQIIEEGGQDLAISVVNQYIKNKSDVGRDRSLSQASAKQEQIEAEGNVSTEVSKSTSENLVSCSIELLDKILDVPKEKRAAVSSNIPKQLVNILEDNQNINISLNALKIVEKASKIEDLAASLGENDSIEKIMGACSSFANNPQIENFVGKILINLGANSMIPQVAEQVIELAQALNMQDPESVDSLNGALNYYGSLLTAPRDIEVEGDSSKRVADALQISIDSARTDSELLLNHIKVLERLSQRETDVKQKIRESDTSKTLVCLLADENISKISQILNTVRAIGGQEIEPNVIINGQTGEEISRIEDGGSFAHHFTLNNATPIVKLLQVLQQFKKKGAESLNHETLNNALSLLNEIANNNENAAAEIGKQNGVIIAAELYQNHLASSQNKEGARLALQLIANLTLDKESFEVITTESFLDKIIRDISDIHFERIIEDNGNPILLEAGLGALQRLSQNEFDHFLLKEKKCPEAVVNVIEKFKQVPKELLIEKKNTQGLNRAYKVISQAMITLRRMLPDALLGRAATKAQAKDNAIAVLNKLVETTYAPEEIDAEKLSQLTHIISQQNTFNKCIEDTLAVIDELASHSKFSKEINLLDDESSLYSDLLTLMSNIPDDVTASYRTLNICRHTLLSLGKEKVLENQEALAPVPEVAETLISLYPNIPIINKIAEDVKSLATTGLTKEDALKAEEELLKAEEAAKEAADDRVERAKTDFGVLVDLIEDLAPKEIRGEITEKEHVKLMQATEILREVASSEEKVAKIEQHDLLAPLSELLEKPNVSRALKENIVEIFSRISKKNEQAVKLSGNALVVHSLASYIKNDGVEVLNSASEDASKEVLCVVDATENLEKLVELAKIGPNPLREVKIDVLTSNVCEIIEPACKRQDPQIIANVTKLLSTLAALNEEAAKIIESSGTLEKVISQTDKFGSDLRFTRNYAIFIASNATSQEKRTKFAQLGVFDKLNSSTQKYKDDIELGLNSCLAYTSLVTGHSENAKLFINSEAIRHLEYLITKFGDHPTLMETIGRLLNTITKNSPESAQKLGELGIANWLTNLFRNFSETSEDLTVVECLKAVNNLVSSNENASKFIDNSFVQVLTQLLDKKPSFQIGLLAMTTLGNLGASSNVQSTTKVLEEGIVESISKFTSSYQTDRGILITALNNLKHLCKDSNTTQLVAQKGGFDIVSKILTSQDFDTELVQKALYLLSEMLATEEMKTSALEHDTLSVLNNLLSAQKKSPQVLETIFQIVEKLATNNDNAFKIYESGFVQASFKVTEEEKLEPNTIHALLKSLLQLSQNEDVATFIGEAGAVTILKEIQSNIDNQSLVETGTSLSVKLLEVESNVEVIVNNNGVEILNSVMEKYPEDEKIAVQVYQALSLIALHSDQMRPEMVNSDMKTNVEEMQKYFESENKADVVREIAVVLENLNKAAEIQKENDKESVQEEPQVEENEIEEIERTKPEEIEGTKSEETQELEPTQTETNQIEEEKKIDEDKKPESLNPTNTPMEKRDKTLNIVKNDPQLKDAWSYIFRGKILKFWTPHGTNWPMHLLLSDDGFGMVLRGKKKWETSIRLDEIDGIWKGYFSNSPFAHPKKLFTKSPAQDLCFFFNTYPDAKGAVQTLYFECQNAKERDTYVDYLVQILRRLKILQAEGAK